MSDKELPKTCKLKVAPVPIDADAKVPPEDRDEFVRAVLAFRTRHKRVPRPVEGFRIAQSLGWRKS